MAGRPTADNFVLFLLLWVAQPQGWSAVQTAAVVLVLRLPTLATGVLLGRAVDRWGGRRLILIDLTGRAVLLLLLVLSSRQADTLPLAPVLVLGGLCGALAPASYAGVRWLVPRIVDTEQLGRANAVVALGDQLPLILGATAYALADGRMRWSSRLAEHIEVTDVRPVIPGVGRQVRARSASYPYEPGNSDQRWLRCPGSP